MKKAMNDLLYASWQPRRSPPLEPYSDLLLVIKAAQYIDPLATDMTKKIRYPDQSNTCGQDGSKETNTGVHYKVSAGALTCMGRIYVPEALRNQVITIFHNHPESRHFEALRTAELGSRDCYGLGLDTTVWKYAAIFEVCH